MLKWMNFDPFNKHIRLMWIYIVRFYKLTQYEFNA